jgi:hypothetical protein
MRTTAALLAAALALAGCTADANHDQRPQPTLGATLPVAPSPFGCGTKKKRVSEPLAFIGHRGPAQRLSRCR